MTRIVDIYRKIKLIGTQPNEPFLTRRRKEFFNIVIVVGAIFSIPQSIAAFSHDFQAGVYHLTWGIACIISLFVHKYVNFTIARFITFFSVFLFGSLASARVGYELIPHIASLTIFIVVFFLYDIKKEWKWILLYVIIEIIMILIIESNIFKADILGSSNEYLARTSIFISTIIFLSLELVFFIQMGENNEKMVTDKLRENNKELENSNKEKDILLKEVHHRVKNNLQIISSLLRLQSDEITDKRSKQKFSDAVNRVRSISNLHEMIYKSEDLSNLDLKDYLNSVARNLIESYGIQKEVKLNISSEIRSLQNDDIVPLSLILNEMLSNSLKHGFENQENCQIGVSIQKLENQYQLIYTDNGNWKENPSSNSFGTELIYSLTEQLDGEIKRFPDKKKSRYEIIFSATTKE